MVKAEEISDANYKSVKWVLLSLNLCGYTHVSVREHHHRCINYLGGGYPGNVMKRFGDRLVVDSCIYDDTLCLYVVPEESTQAASGSAAGTCILPGRTER